MFAPKKDYCHHCNNVTKISPRSSAWEYNTMLVLLFSVVTLLILEAVSHYHW